LPRPRNADRGAEGFVMGKLIYADSDIDIDIDDRALAHLQIVIGSKLRRGESFFMSWKDDPAVGSGRSAIWLDRGVPRYFKFSGSRSPAINREWIAVLAAGANSGAGLVYVAEPNATAPTPHIRGHV
jgi:hypothetical protein